MNKQNNKFFTIHMETNPHRLFLLGGYDLEMLTIKQILERMEGCFIMDKHLQWDYARLSVYWNELSQFAGYAIYGIELQEDITPPQNYHRIDHHNDWADKPSSLEQVAEILGLTLSPYQKLVAANDKGYIPAMKALGASKDEIDEIRRKDRAAQGVTAEDEALAEKAMVENLYIYKGVTVVKAFTSRFSPICDRLYPYQRLLIYTDTEWIFYGDGKSKLVRLLAEDISQKKVFYGGGDNGYIGTVKNVYNKTEIEQFVNKIIKEYEHL